MVATIVTLLFVVAGEFLFSVLHITLPALKIAGGIILMLLFALGMVMGGGHGDEDEKTKSDHLGRRCLPTRNADDGDAARPCRHYCTAITAATTNVAQVVGIAVIVVGIMAFNLI